MPDSSSSDPTLPGGNPVVHTVKSPTPYPFLLPPQEPGELGRLGDYRVLRLLGVGGMGFVFEAEELALRRRVALKVLKPDLAADPANRERFLREARAVAAIASDHVVTIYHVADGDSPYLAMQFLEGESLQTRIEKPPPLTLRAALEIGRQAAEGLAAAHAAGLVHRDIKPANLWLEGVGNGAQRVDSEQGAGGAETAADLPTAHGPLSTPRVKLLDFGLARRSRGETSLTSTGFIVGTPNYMSPEQASGDEVDARADLFSLGCVLYTMLVGELPFRGSSAMAVMMALANAVPPPVNQPNPTIPQGVADLVSRLLEKDPNRRPQSAREVAAALTALLNGMSGSVPLPVSSATISPVGKRSGETLIPGRSDTVPTNSTPRPAPPAPPTPSRTRTRWGSPLVCTLVIAALALASWAGYRAFRGAPPTEPITIAILHSQSGTMAVSENPVIDATLLAIDEVNAAGGILGRQIRAVIVDGKSDADEFGRQAERLLDENVRTIFGCWTSASRKAVREVLHRRNDGLLFYPVQYEGLGDSPRIVYLGPAPNQQIIPAIDFLTRPVAAGGLGKKRLYLVGSDYVFPAVAHEIIRDQVKTRQKNGVSIVGEWFLPLGSNDGITAVTDLTRKNPDAIVNTLNGGTNLSFFRALHAAGWNPDRITTLSLSLTENEVAGLSPPRLAGDYLAASYFQTVDRPQSREFLRKLQERFGPAQFATDPMAAAYTGVHLWAKAAEKAGTFDPTAVRDAVRGLEFDGVRTRVRIDPDNLHAWLPARIGKIRADGSVEVVPGAGSEEPLRPVPYPPSRPRDQWDQFLRGLQFKWDGKWQPPAK